MQPNNSAQLENETSILSDQENSDGLLGLRITYYCVALALNLLTTGVAPKKLSTKPSFKIYIRHMCVIHICFILTQFIVRDFLWQRNLWMSKSTAQRIYTPLIVLFYYLLTFQVTILSLDRWAAVEFKLYYRHVSTVRVSILGVVFMWLLAISGTSGTLTPDLLSYRLLILSSVTLFCMGITVVSTAKLILSLRNQQSSVVPFDAAELHKWRMQILKEASSFTTANDFDVDGLAADSKRHNEGRRSVRRGAVHSMIRSASGIFTVDAAGKCNVGSQHQLSLPGKTMTVDAVKKQDALISSKGEITGNPSCSRNENNIFQNQMNVESKEVLSESDDSSYIETSSSNVISLVRDGKTNTFCRLESRKLANEHKHEIVISCPDEPSTNSETHNQETFTEVQAFDSPKSQHDNDEFACFKKVKSHDIITSQLDLTPDLLSNSRTSVKNYENQQQLSSPRNGTPASTVGSMCDEGVDIPPKVVNGNQLSPSSASSKGKGNALSQSTTDFLSKDTLQVFQIPRIATPTSDKLMCNIRQSSKSSLYPESRPFTPNFSQRNSSASVTISTTKKIYFATLLIAIWTCLTSLPVGLYFLHLCVSTNSIIEINPGDMDEDTKTDHFILLIGPYLSAIVNPLIYCWRLVIKSEWRQRIEDWLARLCCCSSG